MISYLCYSFVLIAFVYPIVAHMICMYNSVWISYIVYRTIFEPNKLIFYLGSSSGHLSGGSSNPLFGSGVVDFAGSGVVHMTGGSVALYASYILGPRQGRFHDKDGNPLKKPGLTKGYSTSLQMLGTLILWFGW